MEQDILQLAKLDVLGRIDAIEATLKQQDPNMPIHLASIRKTLLQYEELVHILPDEKIGILMQGMAKYKNIKLVEEAAKTRTKKKQDVDDF